MLALVLLVVASYVPALWAGFVWDDVVFAEEPVVRDPAGLWSIWFSPRALENEGHYWPVVYTSFWLEHRLWGLSPSGYHAVNVLLHAANVLLLWRLLLCLAVPGAWVVAAVFAVHPLHVESVAWVIERKDVLSALFYLGAALAWIRFVRTPAWGRYLLALGLFTAGLLSKSIVVTLPAALLIWHWWQHGRVMRTDLVRVAPFFLVALCITAADLAFYASREPLSLGYSLVERTLIAARALWFYAGKLLWPSDLAVIYPLWDIRIGDPLAWMYLVAAAGLAAGLWLGRDRWGRGPLAGALFFAVTLSPVLGFVDYGYMQFSFVADRFQYLAGIGVLAVIVGAGVHATSRLPHPLKTATAGLLVVVLAALGTLTWRQAGIYRDELTFFSHILAHNPAARGAHHNLGNALLDANRPHEAVAALRTAVEQLPDAANVRSDLGRALVRLDHLDEAAEHLRRALQLDPRNRNALQNTGEVLRKQARFEEAAGYYRAVLDVAPRYALAHAGLGDALFSLGRHDDALASLQRAASLGARPAEVAPTRRLMGRVLHEQGRFEAAAAQYARALEAAPDAPEALAVRSDLGRTLLSLERFDEATGHFLRVLELDPRNRDALQNMAEALRRQERFNEAVDYYRAALGADPDFALAHTGLGDALFHMQQYEEALVSLERAAALESTASVAGSTYRFMGMALHELGRLEEAAQRYGRALQLNPGDTETLDRFALLRFGQQRYDEALDLYRTMAGVQPGSANVHANIGVTLYYLGRRDEAAESIGRALAMDPDHATARALMEELRTGSFERGR